MAFIGNWKRSRRQDNKDIYKCSECDVKLEIEKKKQEFKVRQVGTEPHNWCDKKHIAAFNKEGGVKKIHSSIEAFVRV